MHPNLTHYVSPSQCRWWIEDKRGRLVACFLSEFEAKSRVKGTSNRARQY